MKIPASYKLTVLLNTPVWDSSLGRYKRAVHKMYSSSTPGKNPIYTLRIDNGQTIEVNSSVLKNVAFKLLNKN